MVKRTRPRPTILTGEATEAIWMCCTSDCEEPKLRSRSSAVRYQCNYRCTRVYATRNGEALPWARATEPSSDHAEHPPQNTLRWHDGRSTASRSTGLGGALSGNLRTSRDPHRLALLKPHGILLSPTAARHSRASPRCVIGYNILVTSSGSRT